MKRKQGFTLVELLAVIVVLAVIALIAVPTILGVIDKAEKGALKNSAYGLIEAATLYYAQNGVTDTERFELDQKNVLNYKGKVENGTVLINSKGKIMVCINDGDNAAYKNYSDTSVVVVSGKTCNVNGSETQVLLDGENTIDEYTNQELTELVDSLQQQIDELKENKTEVSTTTSLEEAVNKKADLTTLTSLSNQHITDINRIDNNLNSNAILLSNLTDEVNDIGTYYASNDYSEKTIPTGEWTNLCSITIPAGTYIGNAQVSISLPNGLTTFTAVAMLKDGSPYYADFKDVTWPTAQANLSIVYNSTTETTLFAGVYHSAAESQKSFACHIQMIKIK